MPACCLGCLLGRPMESFEKLWHRPVKIVGSVTLILASIAALFPSVYLYLRYNISLDLNLLFIVWLQLVAAFGALYFVEPIAYYSALGYAGTYLATLSGNIGNMRVPCAYMAIQATGVKAGSREAEIISAISISGSILTNLAIVAVGAVLSTAVFNIIPPPVMDAFRRFVTPAVYGAMIGQLGIAYPKLLPISIFFPVLTRYFLPAFPGWLINILVIAINVLLARKLYFKKEDDNVRKECL